MTCTTAHVALQVARMGGSGAARMAKKDPKGCGKQRPIRCEDDSRLRGGTIDEGGARATREGGPNPSEG